MGKIFESLIGIFWTAICIAITITVIRGCSYNAEESRLEKEETIRITQIYQDQDLDAAVRAISTPIEASFARKLYDEALAAENYSACTKLIITRSVNLHLGEHFKLSRKLAKEGNYEWAHKVYTSYEDRSLNMIGELSDYTNH
jgi:hypothetical protein